MARVSLDAMPEPGTLVRKDTGVVLPWPEGRVLRESTAFVGGEPGVRVEVTRTGPGIHREVGDEADWMLKSVHPSNPRDPKPADGACPSCGADVAEGWACPECGHDREAAGGMLDPDVQEAAEASLDESAALLECAEPAGTRTARFRASEPNLSQVPRDAAGKAAQLIDTLRFYIETWRREGRIADDAQNGALADVFSQLCSLREIAENDRAARGALRASLDSAEADFTRLSAENRAQRERIALLEAAILDQGGEWATSDVADTGAPELSIGIRLDPMADIDARLAALDGPPEAGVAGVAPVCDARSPIAGLACDKSPHSAGWHRALCDQSHRAQGQTRVWWST